MAIYEEHLVSDFTVYVPGPVSLLVPGKPTNEVERFRCPVCAHEQAPPTFNKKETCVNCDTQWLAQGNHLAVWGGAQ